MTKCQSCKYWGLNRDAILNGIEHGLSYGYFVPDDNSWEAHCENENILKSMHVWENNLPNWVKISIRKDFITRHTFGCAFWEKYSDWKKLWE